MKAQNYRLRACEAADLAAIEEFWVAAWEAIGISLDFRARLPWLRAHLAKLAADGVEIVVGLDEQRRPAGFATIDPQTGHLDQFCVAPSAQGGGLARALIGEAKRRSPGRIQLDVNEDNFRACRFYEREGFLVVGRGNSEMSGLPVRRMAWRKG